MMMIIIIIIVRIYRKETYTKLCRTSWFTQILEDSTKRGKSLQEIIKEESGRK
jgi:hypothetical protein